MRVFFNRSGGNDSLTAEQINRIGNSLGIWDLSFSVPARDWQFSAYKHHLFEDKTGLRLRNMPDGLSGGVAPWSYRLLATMTLHYPAYSSATVVSDENDPRRQFHSYGESSRVFSAGEVTVRPTLGVGFDWGDLYDQTPGVIIEIAVEW